MKKEVFKVKFERYECVSYHTSTPISFPHPKNQIQSKINRFSWDEDDNVEYREIPIKKNQRLIYNEKEVSTTEESYAENYGNPLAKVSKTHTMVVVEKEGDKVSLKLFWGFRERRVGVSWFKVSRNVEYITVNTKTGDVYSGYLHNFQKKRKATKKLSRNTFINGPIKGFNIKLRNAISPFIQNHFEVSNEAISIFMKEIDGIENFENSDFDERLFRFYLDKRGVKYPNNFYLYARELFGPEIRKELKKSDNRLVDAFMKRFNLSGKAIKKALHSCTSLNVHTYLDAKKLFGDDWVNQEPDFIVNILNSDKGFPRSIPAEFMSVISKEELRRVFKVFKKVFIDGEIDSYTFVDHIRMYTELKTYGETDLRWFSDDSNNNLFREEHLDWTDKLQFYKRGYYERIYPKYMYDVIQKPIDDVYPVILDNSTNYNEESSIQSNCVKTYIGRPASLIISLRRGSEHSDERATIEYRLSMIDDKLKCDRVQSLGRFNGRLDESWTKHLLKLDEQVLSSIKDKRFKTLKLTKKCANGTFLESDSDWDDAGVLRWTYKGIESNGNSVFDWI